MMIVYTEACACVTLHDCKAEKHTSLPIYEQAEGGVNQAHTVQLSVGADTQLFTLFSEPRRVPVKALIKLNYGTMRANFKCFASLHSAKH